MSAADLFNPPFPGATSTQVNWDGLSGAAASLAIANAARQAVGPLLVVTASNESAEQLRRELEFFCPLPVMGFPDWETLPYDSFSAHQDIISERLNTLYHLPFLQQGVLVVSFNSLMHRLPPGKHVVGNSLILKTGDPFDFEQMRKRLLAAGYQHVDSVSEHGEFAVRGSIMDIFPMGISLPLRLDLFGNEIDSIRSFDPETQRSMDRVESIQLLPGKEYPINEAGIMQFRARFRERFDVDLRYCPLYQDVSQGISSPGLEYYLPLFFDELASLLDYLPAATVVCRYEALEAAGQEFWQEISSRYEDRQVDRYRPILQPMELFFPVETVFAALNKLPRIQIRPSASAPDTPAMFDLGIIPDLSVNPRQLEPAAALREFVSAEPDRRILFCAESAGRRELLLELLHGINLIPVAVSGWDEFVRGPAQYAITIAPLDNGLSFSTPPLALVTESQLFGGKIAQRRRRSQGVDNTELVLRNLTELHHGDAVVHIEHGVGRYRGLQTLTIDNQATEFLTLEYASQTKLYVPVSSLHLISRYSGADPDLAPLNQLGTDTWSKARRKAAEKIRDVAAELLEIHARRAARQGNRYRCKDIGLEKFAADFPFEETEDQQKAIVAVIADMESQRPMDRLICGDVGFGKTEVAMRAAFVAAQNHKQVAVLVPTTLLAQQHFASFSDRFADWPVNIDVISRFKSAKEQQQSLNELAEGKTDILIGTHKLLNSEIRYHDLGLLIIDEEHRFGVRQKEQLKALRANVDILTLTATPIPRTLNMALSNVRDLSLIVTPPARRLSVKTFIRAEQDSLIREAVWRELLRGGQVFFLHNEVKTIQPASAHLQELLPQARIAVAHGQMPERELEKVMGDFYHKRFNVLVCSTIIESGIDIPSANTIIIRRADRFGLAQLHQLRGRVGRSHHQAYAYLLTPDHGEMTADGHKRIDAIQAATALGSGFTLASHDLEIRGAGELLGEEQSGHIQKIGFSLYLEMLDDAVQAIKAGRLPEPDFTLDHVIEINLRIPALIPETYLPDVHTRLIMYKRISAALSPDELDELKIEMIDRFGLLPESLKLLFRVTALKLQAQKLGIRKIDANIQTGRVEFGRHTGVDPLSIVELVQDQPQRYKLTAANQLQFMHQAENPELKLDFIAAMLQKFRLANGKTA
ncbi:MAG: transcription-repair coupling factor [Pseudohongiellaceae bacterium]